jgi:hypothetical protein
MTMAMNSGLLCQTYIYPEIVLDFIDIATLGLSESSITL